MLCRYDFDKDGYIKKEDVRLVLSHIPIEDSIMNKVRSEGAFTQKGEGKIIYKDRIETQEEIIVLIDEVFGERKRISQQEF
jgi:Ca2+-binding EF-hand superfamily protein